MKKRMIGRGATKQLPLRGKQGPRGKTSDASCEGCVAQTPGFLCDLGVKTEAVWRNGVRLGSRAKEACPRPQEMEDYLVAHLARM